MNWSRGLGRAGGAILLLALLVPALAPWPSAVLDRGPDGSVRLSPFPIALAGFDPFIWECARNSAAVAGLVAGGSLAIGIGLGLVAGRSRFWGKAAFSAMAWVSMAAGPLLIAPGVLLMLGGSRGWDWLAARSILGVSCEVLTRWAALVWVGLATGVPLVALATRSALGRLDPAWSDAARAVGASPVRAWRDTVWPILRPEAARASAAVFTLALVEPAGPLILGLRRTLAVQILDAATRLDAPTRAATLALLAVAISAAGRLAIGRWGGASYVREHFEPPTDHPKGPLGFRLAIGSALVLAGWAFLTAGPIGAMLMKTFTDGRGATAGGWLADTEARTWAANSAMTAGLAVGIDLVLLTALAGRGPMATGRSIRLAVRAFEVVPPLAIGVGAAAVPWLLVALADAAGFSAGRWARSIAIELSPARSPGLLLVAALAAARLPMLARAAELARGQARPAMVEAARMMGVSGRRASRAGQGWWPGITPGRPALLAIAMAGTGLAPALLLVPSSETMTLAPVVLGSVLDAGPIGPRAAHAIATLFVVNLVALAMASRSRVGSLGDWFRG